MYKEKKRIDVKMHNHNIHDDGIGLFDKIKIHAKNFEFIE